MLRQLFAALAEELLSSVENKSEWTCGHCGDSVTVPPHHPLQPCPKLPSTCFECRGPRPADKFWCSDKCRRAYMAARTPASFGGA